MGWYKFLQLADLCSNSIGFVSLLTTIFHQRFAGPVFGSLCIIYACSTAVFELLRSGTGLSVSQHNTTTMLTAIKIGFIAYTENEHYINIRALQSLARDAYREDVVIGNLASYIIEGML